MRHFDVIGPGTSWQRKIRIVAWVVLWLACVPWCSMIGCFLFFWCVRWSRLLDRSFSKHGALQVNIARSVRDGSRSCFFWPPSSSLFGFPGFVVFVGCCGAVLRLSCLLLLAVGVSRCAFFVWCPSVLGFLSGHLLDTDFLERDFFLLLLCLLTVCVFWLLYFGCQRLTF